jgi:hypothetical protein
MIRGIADEKGGADSGLSGHVYGQLDYMVKYSAEVFPFWKILLWKVKYATRVDFYAAYTWKKSGRRKVAEIEVGPYKVGGQKSQYMKLTLYPLHFNDDEFELFKEKFDLLMSHITYAQLYVASNVSYLELSADALSHAHLSFLPYRKYCRKSSIYKEKDGSLGTLYVGSRRGKDRFSIYDKKRQQVALGKKPLTEVMPHTRIESVRRNLGVTPAKLSGISNPFPKLLIADLDKAKALSDDEKWQAFLTECIAVDGVPSALAALPEGRRKKYRKWLDSVPAEWWKPDEIWGDLENALSKIIP